MNEKDKEEILHSLDKMHNLCIGEKKLDMDYEQYRRDYLSTKTEINQAKDNEYAKIFLAFKRVVSDDDNKAGNNTNAV